jgi:hypothetical protein
MRQGELAVLKFSDIDFDRNLIVVSRSYTGEQNDDERKIWGDQRGLNPRQPESQSGALPTELWPPQ